MLKRIVILILIIFTYQITFSQSEQARFNVEVDSTEAFFKLTQTEGVISYFWSFGDNGTSTEPNPIHSYLSSGTYVVCLTIITKEDVEYTHCDTIYIKGTTSCSADFSYEKIIVDNQASYSFTSIDAEDIIESIWIINDTAFYYGNSISNISLAQGSNLICHTIHSTDFCTSTVCQVVINESPTTIYQISGNVFAGNNLLPNGITLLFEKMPTLYYKPIQFGIVNNGKYSFNVLPNKTYICYAIPFFEIAYNYFPFYMPTYFGNTVLWSSANDIIYENDTINYDIHLVSYNSINYGKCSVTGFVEYLSDNTYETNIYNTNWMLNSTIASYENAAVNTPVILMKENKTPIKFTLTDETGYFAFNNIDYGNYLLYTEKAGLNTIPTQVKLNESKTTAENISINIGTSVISFLEQVYIDNSQAEISVFPNPVNDKLNIRLNNKIYDDYSLTITNALGRKIEKIYNLANNVSNLEINVSDYKKGVYFVTISSENEVFKSKFIVE